MDLVESRFVGMKSRGVYETPGGTIMQVGLGWAGVQGFVPGFRHLGARGTTVQVG